MLPDPLGTLGGTSRSDLTGRGRNNRTGLPRGPPQRGQSSALHHRREKTTCQLNIPYPSEVLRVGDEVEVYVLGLDRERKCISLSLKRLQSSPWGLVDTTWGVGQLVSGTVTDVVEFGAFVLLDMLDMG